MDKPPGVVPPGGRHLLIDFFEAKHLGDLESIRKVCIAAAEATGATVIGENFHHFGEGCGVSGVLVLAESHLSIHTWPEDGIATIDVFVCGACDPFGAFEVLSDFFETNDSVVTHIRRGERFSETDTSDQAEIRRLRAALMPFAMLALTRAAQATGPARELLVADNTPVTVQMGLCRAAQRAMAAD